MWRRMWYEVKQEIGRCSQLTGVSISSTSHAYHMTWRWLCEPWSVVATYIWVVSPPPSLWVYGGLLVHGGFWRWLCEPWSVIVSYIWVVSPPPSLWVHGAYWFMGAFDMKVVVWAMECDCCLHMSGVSPTFLVIYWSNIFSLFSSSSSSSMDTFSSLVWIDR